MSAGAPKAGTQHTTLPISIGELSEQAVDSHTAIAAMLTQSQVSGETPLDLGRLYAHTARAQSALRMLELAQGSSVFAAINRISAHAASLEHLTKISSSLERIAAALETMTAELNKSAVAGGETT